MIQIWNRHIGNYCAPWTFAVIAGAERHKVNELLAEIKFLVQWINEE